MKPLDLMCLPVGQMAANCYILSDPQTRDAMVIDPGDDAEFIIDRLISNKLKPIYVVATHGHFDHIMAAFALQSAFDIPFFMHGLDAFLLPRMQRTAAHFLGLPVVDPPPKLVKSLAGKDRLTLGSTYVEVIETPGHTPGSISLYHKVSQSVIVGDLIFADGAVGRTDHDYSSAIELGHSTRIVMQLPQKTTVFPGHGESTTVELAKAYFKV